MNPNTINIGLFGFGTVGQGIYDLYEQRKNLPFNITRIVAKDQAKGRKLPDELFSFDHASILDDSTIELVIEVISDADAAFDIVKKAFENGKDVITANKKMLAQHLPELLQLAKKHQRILLYEAAVCGSIPILRLLNTYYKDDRVQRIEGVFNGTTNFILSEIEKGKSYEQALLTAQERGLAEADPTADVAAFDPKYKLALVMAQAFGKPVQEQHIPNLGIEKLGAPEKQFAEANGWKIRLKAIANSTEEAYVLPTFVDQTDYSYNLQGEDNYVRLQLRDIGIQIMQGKGAGGAPTAFAVLSDVTNYLRQLRYVFPEPLIEENKSTAQPLIDVYIRSESRDLLKVLHIDRLYWDELAPQSGYIFGLRIAVSDLHHLKEAFVAKLPDGYIQQMNARKSVGQDSLLV